MDGNLSRYWKLKQKRDAAAGGYGSSTYRRFEQPMQSGGLIGDVGTLQNFDAQRLGAHKAEQMLRAQAMRMDARRALREETKDAVQTALDWRKQVAAEQANAIQQASLDQWRRDSEEGRMTRAGMTQEGMNARAKQVQEGLNARAESRRQAAIAAQVRRDAQGTPSTEDGIQEEIQKRIADPGYMPVYGFSDNAGVQGAAPAQAQPFETQGPGWAKIGGVLVDPVTRQPLQPVPGKPGLVYPSTTLTPEQERVATGNEEAKYEAWRNRRINELMHPTGDQRAIGLDEAREIVWNETPEQWKALVWKPTAPRISTDTTDPALRVGPREAPSAAPVPAPQAQEPRKAVYISAAEKKAQSLTAAQKLAIVQRFREQLMDPVKNGGFKGDVDEEAWRLTEDYIRRLEGRVTQEQNVPASAPEKPSDATMEKARQRSEQSFGVGDTMPTDQVSIQQAGAPTAKADVVPVPSVPVAETHEQWVARMEQWKKDEPKRRGQFAALRADPQLSAYSDEQLWKAVGAY